ncbi:hypothetical protein TM074_00435 [Candidatus Nanosynbacter sp. TM7-074]|uniref:Uncharacterized protein n=1 Tax=Candidatus Nanosynbacter sp. TM7-074 TaxID=3158573 RepID=A0AB39JCC9_9BACT
MRRKYSLPRVGMLAIVVALVVSVTAFFIYTYAIPSSPAWTITGKSWVTKQFDKSDTTNFGSNWVVAPGRLKNVKPGDTVDWWHSLFVSGGTTSQVVTGVQQDVFDITSNQPIDNDFSLGNRGAWHNEDPQQHGIITDWKGYAWKRMNNPADYRNTTMETLNGKTRLEDLHGDLGNNKFMYTRIIRNEDMGKRICQRIYWSKQNSSPTAGWGYSPYACVEVPYNYDIEPSVGISSDYIDTKNVTSIEGINAGLNNKGTEKSQGSSYALARFVARGTEVSSMAGVNAVSLPGGTVHDWSCAIVRLIKEKHRELNIDNGTCKEIVANGGKNQIPTGQTSIATNAADNLSGVNLNANDSLCYVAMVSNYNGSAPSTDFRYAIKCIRTSNKPKVQVWGGDIKTDKEVITSKTSNTILQADSHSILDKSTIQSMGLWGTGLDDNGNILGGTVNFSPGEYKYKGGDKIDPHWSLICSQDSFGGNGNQRAYSKASGAIADLPNCHNDASNLTNEYQARTVVKTQWQLPGSGDRISDGWIPCSDIQNKELIGDAPIITYSPHCRRGVWRSSSRAAWISINSFGRHTHFRLKPDASVAAGCLGATGPVILNCGNTYVFRLKNVKLGDLKNAKKLQFKFSGSADNFVRAKINGHEMDVKGNENGSRPEGTQYSGWGLSGYDEGSALMADIKEGTVLYSDGNVIDIYIKSSPSHMGLLIEDISVSYTMDRAYQNMYGSWAEYGIISGGRADSASGAGLSSSFNGRDSLAMQDYNKLTFANTPKFGNFSIASLVPDNFTLPSVGGVKGSVSGNVNINSLATGEYTAGNINLVGAKLDVGKSIVIKSTGTVRISGDLLYTDSGNVRSLPQLVIYAKNIVIDPSVGEVNAWLITPKDGYVSTCGAVFNMTNWLSNVSEALCGKKLRINGPIKAGHLFLRRTYGGRHASSAKNDPNMHPGTPAEIINLRADAYLWSYSNYRNTGAISTMNIRELPPRY